MTLSAVRGRTSYPFPITAPSESLPLCCCSPPCAAPIEEGACSSADPLPRSLTLRASCFSYISAGCLLHSCFVDCQHRCAIRPVPYLALRGGSDDSRAPNGFAGGEVSAEQLWSNRWTCSLHRMSKLCLQVRIVYHSTKPYYKTVERNQLVIPTFLSKTGIWWAIAMRFCEQATVVTVHESYIKLSSVDK